MIPSAIKEQTTPPEKTTWQLKGKQKLYIMTTVALTLESHKNPAKFRCKFEESVKILGPNVVIPENDKLPVKITESKVGIVGAGFGGISAALTCIKNLKVNDFAIFEKHANFGGCWYANTYPGCASDIPAIWYSYWGELNSTWTALRPPQYEMEEYILKIADKYGLKYHARFKTAITLCKYDEERGEWTLTGRDIETGQKFLHTCKILILLVGGLVVPKQFDAPGLSTFEGKYMHSALWDHSVSFKDKNVVVIGNGCSAAQVTPALLKDYEPKLIVQVFRSKHWIMPPLPLAVYSLYKLLSFHRWGIIFVRSIIAAGAELKYPLYSGTGFIANIFRYFYTKSSISYMKTAPEKYHDMLIPDFKIGCKRMIYDYTYLPSLSDPRLDLSNVGIDHIEPKHVVLKDGTRLPCDIIVACTGYDMVKANNLFASVYDRNGNTIASTWEKEGTSAYETVLVKDCPNFFILGGPNSFTGHSLVVLGLENASKLFANVGRKVLDGTYKSVCVTTKAYDTWNERIQSILKTKVFGSPIGGCVSWYSSSNGRNDTSYPFSQVRAWWAMRSPKWNNLEYEAYDKKNV